MICADCGAENRARRRFCLSCGAALARSCPSCAATNEPDARFCGECGTALTGPGAAPEPSSGADTTGGPSAERRLVSILFADLVGSTAAAEAQDPEDVRTTLTRYAELAREILGRYGGTVEKYIGDAVMAVWGTPVAHEDDAERAVRAALDLVGSVPGLAPGLTARAAVLSGEAAVTVGAHDQSIVAGDLVNAAARLQSVAKPDTVLVGESVMRAASPALTFEPAGEHLLKGRSEPVRAWRALRVVAQRRGTGRSEALETPFVGRDEEFRQLRESVHLTGRDPRARLVSITGPAGIGKSRLAWELEKYLDGVVERVRWHRGRSPAYGSGVTFWALGEMVRQRCGLVETDDEATTRARVRAMVEQHVADVGEHEWIGSALLALLGIEPAPPGKELLFAAWRRFFEHVAATGTVVMVFEDLHWADMGLLDFIEHLLEWSKAAPILVVTLARPELFDRRPDWGAGRRTFTAMTLEPLPDAAMRELISGLVPQLPSAAVETIVQRADGIPLYAVETVRMLLAEGRLEQVDGAYRPTRELAGLAIPESLRSLIASRLDALDPADRALMQDASVLGQAFALDALAAVSGAPPSELQPRLRRLVRRELLSLDADPRSPERGQYTFVQSMIREVAYSTLARPDRRARHLAAARYFETLGGEIAGVLASHYLSAHDASAPGPEQDAVAAQARIALRGAAERAAALGSHAHAATYLEQALQVTTDPAEAAALMEREAVALGFAGRYERSLERGRGALERYLHLGDARGVARARAVLGTTLIDASRIADAKAELERAIEELPDDADPADRADVLAKLARAYYRNVEPQKALETADRALVIAEHHGLTRTIGEAMVTKGTALLFLDRHREASVLLRGGIDLARREGDVPTALRGLANVMGQIAGDQGHDAAMAMLAEAIDLAETVGDLGQIVWHVGNSVFATFFGGEPLEPTIARVEELLTRDLETSDRLHLQERLLLLRAARGDDVDRPIRALTAEVEAEADPQALRGLHHVRAVAAVARGELDAATREIEALAEKHAFRATHAEATLLAVIAGDERRAHELYERALTEPAGAQGDQAFRRAAGAAVAAIDGRREEALAAFRDAMRILRTLNHRYALALAGMAMARLLGRDVPEARAAGEEAVAIFERMGAMPYVRMARAVLGEAVVSGA